MKTKLTDFKKMTVADVPWVMQHVHALEKANAELEADVARLSKSAEKAPARASLPSKGGVSAVEHSKVKSELAAANKFLGKVLKERDELKASLKSLQDDYDKLAESVEEPVVERAEKAIAESVEVLADEPIPYVPVEPAVEEAVEPAIEEAAGETSTYEAAEAPEVEVLDAEAFASPDEEAEALVEAAKTLSEDDADQAATGDA